VTRPAEAERSRIAPARAAAYEVLYAVSERKADLPHALARVRSRLTDERDRALAGEIATGTLRWQAAFDHVIAAFIGRPIAKLDPQVVTILRSSAFQLLHLERVPAAAVVSDAVSLTRKVRKSSAASLVNAVLRRISRERDHLPLPPRPSDPDDRSAQRDYLSITLSHPRWLVARWLDRYGFEATEAWARFNNAPAPLTLRVNTLRVQKRELAAQLAGHGVRVRDGRHAPDALIVEEGNPLLTPLANHGLFFVQDEASQLVARLVQAHASDRVLDACASPGGKTTAIAAAMGDRGLIVSADVRGRRVDLLARTVEQSGASCVRIIQADAAALPFSGAPFDWVLLDAPCSGLGTIRRDPDVRWRIEESDLPRLAGAQAAMLQETARVLGPGGRLVYATCSSEPEENEDVVSAFVERPGFEMEGEVLRTLPFRDGLEAFFGVVIVKSLR
jgi:16S rRNA (cytosine967-C5)-methyltransferase